MTSILNNAPSTPDGPGAARFQLRSLFIFVAVLSAAFACSAWQHLLGLLASGTVIVSTTLSVCIAHDPKPWASLETTFRKPSSRFALTASCGALTGMAVAWIFVRLDHNVIVPLDDLAGDLATMLVAAMFGAYSTSLFRNASPVKFGAIVGFCTGITTAVLLSQFWFPANTYYANYFHFFFTVIGCLVFGMVGIVAGVIHFSTHRIDLSRFRDMKH